MVAALAAALAAAVALAALGPTAVLAVAVALVQLLVAGRWFSALDVPGAVGGVLVGGGAGIAADVVVVVRDERRPLGPAAAVLGLALLASLVAQLVRRDGRERATASMAATTTLAALAVLGATYLAATAGGELDGGGSSGLVVAAVVAAGCATVLATVPLPTARNSSLASSRSVDPLVRAGAGLAVAALVGLAVGAAGDLSLPAGAAVALGSAVAAQVGVTLARRTAAPEPLVTAGVPLLLAGPAAFVLGRLFAG